VSTLGWIAEYRAAARLAVDAPASRTDRYLALLELVEMAKRDPDPLIALWGERVVWQEAQAFLGLDDHRAARPGIVSAR